MLRFVVMTNLFPVTADLRVVEQYDLKGSTVGRTAGAEKIRSNPTTGNFLLVCNRLRTQPSKVLTRWLFSVYSSKRLGFCSTIAFAATHGPCFATTIVDRFRIPRTTQCHGLLAFAGHLPSVGGFRRKEALAQQTKDR